MKKRFSKDVIAVVLVAAVALAGMGIAAQAGPRNHEQSEGSSFIGVIMQPLTAEIVKGLDLNTKDGVLIADVVDDSPAEEAGIEDGDVIIEYDGMKVRDPEDLKRMVLKSRVGDKVKVKVIRDDEAKVIELIVGEKPEETAFHFEMPKVPDVEKYVMKVPGGVKDLHKHVMYYMDPSRKLGVQVTAFDDDDLAGYFDVRQGEGVLVLGIEDDSVAEEAGIRSGDVIVEVDGDEIDSVKELQSKVKDLDSDEEFDIVVLRHGKKMTLQGMFAADDDDAEAYTFQWKGTKPDMKNLQKEYKIKSFTFNKDEMDKLREEMLQLKKEMKQLKKDLKKELRDRD